MENKRILIIDDEGFFVEPIKMFLKKYGFEIIVASDGISGLQKARKESPDLIMLDLMLPGIDGFLICRLLKFDEKYRHIPVVIVSAKDSERDKNLGKECGADMYITKPVDPRNLLKTISNLLA